MPSYQGDLSFVAIDFETANSFRGSACQIGFAVIRNGLVEEVGAELCRPPQATGPEDFEFRNSSIHGIKWPDVKDKPFFSEVWSNLFPAFGGLPLVAHNAAFDFSVLRNSLAVDAIESPEFDYACTLVICRRLLNLFSNRLPDVSQELGISLNNHHDAGEDALACAQIAIELCRKYEARNLDTLLEIAGVRWGHVSAGQWKGSVGRQLRSMLPSPSTDASPDHFLYGKNICITGALPGGIVRQEAFERIAHYGGTPQDGVTKQTSILVIGDLDPEAVFLGVELTGKMKKAFRFKEAGQDIEIMSGDDFLSYLD